MKPGEGALTDANGENFAVEMSYRMPSGEVSTWLNDGYGSMRGALGHIREYWDDPAAGGVFIGAHVIVPGGALRLSRTHGDTGRRTIGYRFEVDGATFGWQNEEIGERTPECMYLEDAIDHAMRVADEVGHHKDVAIVRYDDHGNVRVGEVARLSYHGNPLIEDERIAVKYTERV